MDKCIQLLRDANIKPNHEIIARGLGGAYGAFVNFAEGLKQYGITLMEWRYYNDGKVWLSKGEYKRTTPRGAQKITPVFWLSIWQGFFKITFYFNIGAKEELLNLPVTQSAKDLIHTAQPMGKTMRFIPLTFDIYDDEQLNDVYVIAQYKKTISK